MFAIKKYGMVIEYSPASIICHPLVKCSHPRFSYDACFPNLLLKVSLMLTSTTEG